MSNFWTNLPRPILALAPMEGVTDRAFRGLCREAGADVVYTEFVSADAVAFGAKKVIEKLRFDQAERPVVAQIFGRHPESFATAAATIERLGFDGLDINLGCPARKVIGSGSGVALLRDPAYVRQLVEAALSATSLPVSIKVRASIRRERHSVAPDDTSRVTAVDLVKALDGLPLAAIMVHGRTAESRADDTVDSTMIRAVKDMFPGIVLANGGIRQSQDIASLLQATGADGVGIARGAWGQPWIFSEAVHWRQTGAWAGTSWAERRRLILAHAEALMATKGPHGLLEFRKHIVRSISGLPGAAAIRRQAVTITSVADVAQLLTILPSQ